jgi:glycosyltransferase involved in cell wall biosynthesis
MRILHVTSTFPRSDDDHVGGFVLALAQAQSAAGAEVRVVAPHSAGRPVADRVGGVAVRRFRYAPERWELLAGRGGLVAAARGSPRALLVPGYVAAMSAVTSAAARRWGADVVHAHWWVPGGVAGVLARRGSGAALVVTFHGSDVHLAARPSLGFAFRRVAAAADGLTAVSRPLADDVDALLGGDRCEVLAMPVAPVVPVPLPPPPPPLRLAGVGRLVPEKGWDVLLAAAAILRDAGVEVEVDLVGDGPERARLQALAGRGVRFHGGLAPAAAQRVVAGAHAVVVPSRREGLGLVALEALALGRPVVASRVGGLVEAVDDGDDGALVAADDPPALAAAVRALPLVPPRGDAVARHRPEVVAEASFTVYGRAVAHAARRWRRSRPSRP